MKNKIRKFIEDNSIEFIEGSRNFSITVLIGYVQYLDLSKDELEEELSDEITEDCVIQDEIDRLWSYCTGNNYKKYWTTDDAKNQWVF